VNWLSLIENVIQHREFVLVQFELRNLLLVCLLVGWLLAFLLASLVFYLVSSLVSRSVRRSVGLSFSLQLCQKRPDALHPKLQAIDNRLAYYKTVRILVVHVCVCVYVCSCWFFIILIILY